MPASRKLFPTEQLIAHAIRGAEPTADAAATVLKHATDNGIVELVPGSTYDKAAQALVEAGKLVQHKTGGQLYGYTSSYSPVPR